MEENVMNTEATIPEENVTQESATEEGATAETDTTATEDADTQAAQTAEDAEREEFTLRYRHEDLKVTKEEAKRLAQLGKHYEESDKKLLDDLDYVATLKGMSVKDYVKSLVESDESDYREELVAQFGEDSDVVGDMLELRRQKNRKAYDQAVTNRNAAEKQAEEEAQKSATAKLAEQFEEARALFPEYDSIEKVPDAVIKRAIKSGNLELELLRYERSERTRVEEAKATSEKNKNQNVGSVASDKAEDNLMSAFKGGVWS